MGKATVSDHEDQYAKWAKKHNKPIPDTFVTAKQKRKEMHMPISMRSSWRLFQELSPNRTQTMNGPGVIPYAEILAYTKLWDIQLSGLELIILRTLDGLFLGALHDQRDSQARTADPKS